MINRIDKKFQEDKKLLSIYFSAGHPSLEDTVRQKTKYKVQILKIKKKSREMRLKKE